MDLIHNSFAYGIYNKREDYYFFFSLFLCLAIRSVAVLYILYSTSIYLF
jgi:hypothetical protein